MAERNEPTQWSLSELLRVKGLPEEEFNRMGRSWRELKAEELRLDHELSGNWQPEPLWDRLEKWAAAYDGVESGTVAPLPLDLLGTVDVSLTRSYLKCDAEGIRRFSKIFRKIFEYFGPNTLLQALRTDPRFKDVVVSALGMHIDSEKEIILANVAAWVHFGGLPSFRQLPALLQRVVAESLQQHAYVIFSCKLDENRLAEVVITPWRGKGEGVFLSIAEPKALPPADFSPVLQWLRHYSEMLSEMNDLWLRRTDPIQLKPSAEKAVAQLSSYAGVIRPLIAALGPEMDGWLGYHAWHVLARGVREAIMGFCFAEQYPEGSDEMETLKKDAAELISRARRVNQLTIDILQVLALESQPENSLFSVEDVLKAAFEKLASLEVPGNESFKLEMTSTPSAGNTLIGDRRLIEKAFFGILHEVLYCRDEVVARVNVTDQLVDGSPGVRIDFHRERKWHWCSLEAGFTGYQIAQRVARVHSGQFVVSAGISERPQTPGIITLWLSPSST
ncbi:MAG TPA: hypothetical protein VFE51_18875 [Verrucomicrobiae bacterium]|nr:hypothetical protein [Verrucomicrobiae bacterium]